MATDAIGMMRMRVRRMRMRMIGMIVFIAVEPGAFAEERRKQTVVAVLQDGHAVQVGRCDWNGDGDGDCEGVGDCERCMANFEWRTVKVDGDGDCEQ